MAVRPVDNLRKLLRDYFEQVKKKEASDKVVQDAVSKRDVEQTQMDKLGTTALNYAMTEFKKAETTVEVDGKLYRLLLQEGSFNYTRIREIAWEK